MIIDESEIQENKHITRWLIGPWNSQSTVDFGIALIQPNQRVESHYHEQVEEIIYTVDGEITLLLGNEKSVKLKRGLVVHIPPNQTHALHNQTQKITKLVVVKSPSLPADKKFND